MVLSTMSFGDYRWKVNPIKIEVINSAQKNQYSVPSKKTCIEALQRKPAIYKGEGEFCGEDCLLQYRALEALFLAGKKGILSVPDMPSVYAWFTGLRILGDSRENLLTYSFEFTEADTSLRFADRRFHICTEGETLYDVAFDYGIEVEKLVELNPGIKRPDELTEGEQVRLC